MDYLLQKKHDKIELYISHETLITKIYTTNCTENIETWLQSMSKVET
jgi:hypothetical protein